MCSSHENRWARTIFDLCPRNRPYPRLSLPPLHTQHSPDLSTCLQNRSGAGVDGLFLFGLCIATPTCLNQRANGMLVANCTRGTRVSHSVADSRCAATPSGLPSAPPSPPFGRGVATSSHHALSSGDGQLPTMVVPVRTSAVPSLSGASSAFQYQATMARALILRLRLIQRTFAHDHTSRLVYPAAGNPVPVMRSEQG